MSFFPCPREVFYGLKAVEETDETPGWQICLDCACNAIVYRQYLSTRCNVVLLINMELALITPPVGMNLFVIKGISEDSSIQDIISGSAPFAIIMVLEIILLCFVPGLATWLPSVLK